MVLFSLFVYSYVMVQYCPRPQVSASKLTQNEPNGPNGTKYTTYPDSEYFGTFIKK